MLKNHERLVLSLAAGQALSTPFTLIFAPWRRDADNCCSHDGVPVSDRRSSELIFIVRFEEGYRIVQDILSTKSGLLRASL